MINVTTLPPDARGIDLNAVRETPLRVVPPVFNLSFVGVDVQLMVSSVALDASALDQSARDELRRYSRSATATFLVGLVLFIGFAVLVTTRANNARYLQATGTRVPGVISDTGTEGSWRFTTRSVDVTFPWSRRTRTEVIHLKPSSATYRKGQPVLVIVDANDPGHVTLAGESNESPLSERFAVAVFVISVSLTVTGMWTFGKARRQRRVLSASTWRRFSYRYKELRDGGSVSLLILLSDASNATSLLTVTTTARWRIRLAKIRDADQVDVAGDPERFVVLRVPGTAQLLSARVPMSTRARKRWLTAFDASPTPG